MHRIAGTCFTVICSKLYTRKDLGNCQRPSHCKTTLIRIQQIWWRQCWQQWAAKLRTTLHTADVASSNFNLFGPVKVHLRGQNFQADNKLKHSTLKWLCYQDKTFYAAGISNLPEPWNKCVSVKQEYIEKGVEFGSFGMYILFAKNKKEIKSRPTLNHLHIYILKNPLTTCNGGWHYYLTSLLCVECWKPCSNSFSNSTRVPIIFFKKGHTKMNSKLI